MLLVFITHTYTQWVQMLEIWFHTGWEEGKVSVWTLLHFPPIVPMPEMLFFHRCNNGSLGA